MSGFRFRPALLLPLAGLVWACQPAPTATPTVAAPTATRPAPSATSTPSPIPPTFTPSPIPPSATPSPVPPTDTPAGLDPAALTLVAVAAGLQEPVALADPGDGTGRLVVVEQPGRLRVIQAGQLLAEPFLDLTERVGDGGNEQGLLGLAFHPDYAVNGYFFVNYTDNNGDTVIARFSVSAADPNRADPASERVVLQVDQPYSNHNGGDLAFGPDGYLYIGLGDGGSGGDPQNNAQDPLSLLGKLLRLDINTGPDEAPYVLPPDNPFLGRADARPEIWALGLRNPWRFAFDAQTGDLYIADVGQSALEEINFQPAASAGGANYGWRFYEGSQPYKEAEAAPPGLTPPIHEYRHNAGGCAVTGGYVYRGAALPALAGQYVFGDYCTGRLWALRPAAEGWLATELERAPFNLSAFGQDQAGELYLLDHRGGGVYRLAGRP